jgi:hypothetical protein
MAVTQNTYTGNGSTTNYSITFEYLEETDIKVTLNGTLTTAYTLANATTISFTTAPAVGVAIRIYRDTDVDSLQSTFFAGSAIRAQDLNDNFTQSNYSVQEIKDRFLDRTGGTLTGALDAGGFKITNVGTPTNNADASTKAYVDSTIGTAGGYAAAAASSASAAATSASNASTSATNSATSASASATSAAASLASQTAAATSQSAAASSASTASTQASNASTSASNAATSATNASNSATSAASSAASALAAFDSFDDRYLGAKATDPTVDNDGDPLNAGDLYYNTTSSVMKVYTGSAWVVAYVPGDAASISFTPYSTIASNNVQGAIQELTDEKLNLTGGTLTGNLTAFAFIPNGSTAPSNGVYLPSANNVAISTNGTGRLTVDANGNVGFNRLPTNSANYTTLDISGTNGSQILLNRTGSLDAFFYSSNGLAGLGAGSGSGLAFFTNSSGLTNERLRITSTGALNFVGAGTAGSTQAVSFNGSAPVNSLVIDSSGRLGLGTSSPLGKTHIQSSSTGLAAVNSAGDELVIENNSTAGMTILSSNTSTGTIYFADSDNAQPGSIQYDHTGNSLNFRVNNSDRARIDSSGRLLVGTVSGSGKVTVSGNSIGTTVALTDAATVAVDLSLANYYTLTLGGNRTLGAPSNQNAGQSGVIVITQDGTGSRTLAYNSVWKFPGGTAPTLTTTANAVDVLVYYVESATRITARVLSDVK